MPVLNYHREVKDMPDMSKLQKCDTCGVEQIGNRMYYSHPKKRKIEVICRTCFISHPSRPTPRALDKCPSCAGKGSYQIGVYSETCATCHGSGTCQ